MKKLFTAILISVLSLNAFANKPKDGKVILIITVQVKDIQAWKAGFEKNEVVRQKAGIKVLTIGSDEKSGSVTVIEQAESRSSAEAFLGKLKEKMKETGASPVEVKVLDKED